jgi:RNA:NAD 2'-phosphotransferase (TPT1/KptA family)
MTEVQKYITKALFAGSFLVKTQSESYTLYDGNANPIARRLQIGKALRNVVKRDNKKRFVISRKDVRKLHGKSWIKQYYKKLKCTTNNLD